MRLVNTRVALLSFALGASLCAQSVATGAPPFATMQSVPEGQIDLANLNVHLAIPVVHKAGVGMPFDYVLVYDSAIWAPGYSWQPASNWGWSAQTQAEVGYLNYVLTSDSCLGAAGQVINYNTYTLWVYVDRFGIQHGYGDAADIMSTAADGCADGTQPNLPHQASSLATDASGYTAVVSAGSGYQVSGNINARSGAALDPPLASGTGSGSVTDADGNKISTNGSSFTDTLGLTALTVSGSQSPNGSMTFTFSTVGGGTAQAVVKYGSASVATDFTSCAAHAYSTSSVPLVTEIDLPDGTKYSFTYYPDGRLETLTLPTGGDITYQYTGGSNGITCGDGSTATLTRTTPDGTWTYQHTESGTAWTTLVTDPLGNQTNYQFQGIYQTERDAHSGAVSGQLLQTVYTCYNNAASPCNATSVVLPITQRSITTKLDNSLESKTAATYNGYGLLLETDRYDFGNGAPGALARKTIIAYATLSGIYDHPASIEVDNGAGAKKAYTSFAYDTKGNTTSMSRWVAGTTNLTTNFTVNANGTVATATDANGAVTSYSYTGSSCNGAFPTAISLPGNLSTSAAWNCYVALPASRTDANGQTTSFAFNDPFARLTSISNPDGGVTNFTYTAASGSAPATSEGAMVFNNGASTVDTLTMLDSLGRPHIEQRRQGPGSANFDSVEIDYDADGRAYHVSQPYQGTAGQAAPVGTAFTTTNFDGLNRPSEITDGGNGTLSYAYAGNDVLTTLGPAPTGENTKRRQFEYDGLGEVTSVCELTAASGSGTCGQSTSQTGYWTTYTYNATGEITGVSQNAQSGSPQTRSFAFDALGRLTSETNPESGTTAYTFDTDSTCGTSNGDLVKRVDAMGNVTCYTHDALRRVTAITYPSGPYSSATAAKTFVFDAATVDGAAMANAKGRLAEAFTGPASGKITDEGFGYDAMGRVTTNPQCAPATSGCVWYPMAYTYDQAGDLTGDSTDLTYGRDAEGRISSVTSNYVDGYHDADILTSPSYNAAGDLTSALL
ncbi:MAG: hypothetical protein ACRD1M_07890, partial [Terriglobales bacterium]